MIGGFLPPGLTPPAIVGVRVVGTYPGPGKFSLAFSNDSVSVACADLVPQSLPYTTTMTREGCASRRRQPLPAPFTMRADGRLAGPPKPTSRAGDHRIPVWHPDLRGWPHRTDLHARFSSPDPAPRDRHARGLVTDHAARVGERARRLRRSIRARRSGQEDLGRRRRPGFASAANTAVTRSWIWNSVPRGWS